MNVYSEQRPPHALSLVRPSVYSATVADPPRLPRPVLLRYSCGHVGGIGIVWRRQRYLRWARCAK